MEMKEWVNKLRCLSPEQLVQAHFGLQEKIKKHYKLRAKGNNLEKAKQLCEQMVAMAELVYPAMKAIHEKKASEYRRLTGQESPDRFYPPTHYGYKQLIVIMKNEKNLNRVAELEAKRSAEGWRS
ncbi:hypothetical protein GTGU_00279 [Trabulsiella guamensis ATCC 49490]|uniref:Uncharacterized protein n=1 Tax=Trabulsiella guamensis ATCC 49490 TaxID=1005994 RepID=A0A085AR18_9ENTR|nr:hypothetical protein [Trabulsiella guamensis]KFC12663.1 hypothetical protein GTGU_00279 [Trabulsiella guamensis ATCC 49490]